MLEIKIDDEKMYVSCEGSSIDLLAELLMAINAMYTQIHKSDPGRALSFKRTLITSLIHPACPAWTPNKKGEGISIIFPKR